MEHRKIENSPFDPFVKWFFPKLLRFVPKWMSANVISVLGIFIAMFAGLSMAISGAFADVATARFFYLLGAFFVLLTWVTDTMDGVVARARNQLTKTGYYLDHFGDALATVFIGLGIFATNGSHILIGFFCVTVYMLFHVHMHIRKSQLKVMELPFFGPTETRFLIIAVIIVQTFVGFREFGVVFPELTGREGVITTFLDVKRGLTLVDSLGLVAAAGGTIGLIVEIIITMRLIGKEDKKDSEGK